MDEVFDAHPLDEDFPFGLVRFLENALCGGFLQDGFFRYLPTPPVIKLAVVENDRRAVFAMRPPYAALPFRPDVSDKEDEPVDEAELRSEREIWLETLPRVLRKEAQPPGKRLPANFPWKTPEQYLADGP